MGQEQGYTNLDDFQVFEFYSSFYTAKSSSVGWSRKRMHFSKSKIKCTFYLSTRFFAHGHRFLSKLVFLDFIIVKY